MFYQKILIFNLQPITTQPVKRQSWIDYARGIAIMLVLYRHVFAGIKNSGISVADFLYLEHSNIIFFSFRMPLFFIVSGVFVAASFAKRGMKEFIRAKWKTILYPYFLWGGLQITLQLIFPEFVNNPPEVSSYLYLLYLPREIEQFWYLYALFNVSVLYAILKYPVGLKAWHHIVLGLGMFFSSTYCYQHDIIIGFLGDILHYYVFIALGDIIHKFVRNPKNIPLFQSWKVFLLLLLPFLFSQFYFLLLNLQYPDYNYQYVEYFRPLQFIPIALIGCAFIVSISFLLQRYKAVIWLRVLGRHSLYIYVSHVLVFASLRVFMMRVLGIENVPFLLITGIAAGLAIPVLLYKIATYINMQWIFSLEDSQKKFTVNT